MRPGWKTGICAAGIAMGASLGPWASAGPRMDQVQVIGTHNSYHGAPHPALMDLIRRDHPGDASAVRHTHRPIREQLERLGVRQIELDLYADPDGGLFASPAGAGLAASAGYASFPTPPADVMREP